MNIDQLTPEWKKCFSLLLEPDVSEIEVNGRDLFFMKKAGKRLKIEGIALATDEEYYSGIEKSLVPLVRHFSDWSRDSYIFEGPLEFTVNRTRVKGRTHIILPPSSDTALITIAKKSTSLTDLDSISERGSMSLEMKEFIRASVKGKMCVALSGGTGAGKALHSLTKIPTPLGWKTVEEVSIGDYIFDENGSPTKVLRKYCPRDSKSFELTFKSGDKIKTSAGHLWKVSQLNKKLPRPGNKRSFFTSVQEETFRAFSENVNNDEKVTISKICEIFSVSRMNRIVLTLLPLHYENIAGEITWSKSSVIEKFATEKIRIDKKVSLLNIRQERPSEVTTTQEMFLQGIRNGSGRLNFAVEKLSKEVEYPEKNLPIDPYTLGAWLGDGMSDRGNICGVDVEIRDRVSKAYEIEWEKKTPKDYHTKVLYDWKFLKLRQDLGKNNLLSNKHIPEDYIYSSKEQRIALLSGLVDTDGSCSPDGLVQFGVTNKKIVESAREIALSLGFSVNPIRKKQGAYKDKDGNKVICKMAYSFSFVGNELDLQVPRKKVRLERRLESNLSQQSRHKRNYVLDIKEIKDNPDDYYCFEVDSPSHLFLCGESFIPTHNTTMLEAMAKLIPMNTRIGVAEDTPELELIQENVTYLHSVPWSPGMDANRVATLDWCVAQFNRMRTDMLIVGETRGKEFASFLTAANSGMEGCMTTIHANTPARCLDKMSNFALKGSDRQPIRAVNTDIANAVDLIIQLIILPDGRHKVHSITEITQTISNTESATITTNPLYVYDSENDTFIKNAVLGDSLRKVFNLRGVNISPFLKSPPGTVQKPHFSTENPDGVSFNKPSSGLPIYQTNRAV